MKNIKQKLKFTTMKAKLFTLLAALVIAAGAMAQTTIATMETTAATIKIAVEWTGDGTLTANGVALTNNRGALSAAITPAAGVVTLTATGNVQLTYLYCGSNNLTSLDVSKCAALEQLNCYGNPLTSLDVSKCAELTHLDCGDNTLTSLDVTKCAALTGLSCSFNTLTSLDVTKCAALTGLHCGANTLTSLDVTKCAALTYLSCESNALTSLDVTKCAALTDLSCESNALTSLDLSNCPLLTHLYADNQQIEVTASPEATKFTNPVLYKNQTATELVKIEGTPYAKGDDVIIPVGDKAVFTSTAIGSGTAFGGTITIKRVVLVAFNLQDGSPVSTSEVEVNTVIALSPFNPVRPGYTFNGWFTAAEGGDKATFPYKVTTDITFYAQWTFNIAVEDAETVQLTAYATPDGIAVSGVPTGEIITVYSGNGIQVAAVAAQDGVTFIPLSAQGLYIVKTVTGTVKVVK